MKKSASWILMFILCLFMAIMMGLSVPGRLEAEKVVDKGQLVQVDIVRGSESHWGRNHAYYLHFIYKGQKDFVKVSPEFLHHIKGLRSTQLLHLQEYPTIFLQPGHTESGQLLSAILLIAFSLSMVIYSVIKILKAFRYSEVV